MSRFASNSERVEIKPKIERVSFPLRTTHDEFLEISSVSKSSNAGEESYFDHVSCLAGIVIDIITLMH